MNNVYIVAATRTPVGKGKGQLATIRADTLLISVLRGALAQVPTLDPEVVEDVVIGCAMPEGEQGLNIARSAALLAGLPISAGAMTLNRFCASGLSAIQMAAERIQLGQADIMIAGGVESMSRVPMMGFHPAPSPLIFENPSQLPLAWGMGATAENLAQIWNISREAQDSLSLLSHQRAVAAQDRGDFTAEITPLEGRRIIGVENDGEYQEQVLTIAHDEGPRRNTDMAALGRLKPAFHVRGSVTAGNSSQISDGASALILVSEQALVRHQLTPLARVMGFSVKGVAPEIMGLGPVKVVPPLLERHGLEQSQLDWIELNEAFAAQVLAVQKHLAFDPECLNPVGGAIALGHPLGASGAIRTTTLIHGLRRTQGRYGLVTLCVGMGQGIAGLFERL
ncbi:MAG: acetyl-CoA C-acyltransferase [Betaproteobacteria bacterium]|nr:acetyl-CoA C-acyltransferase [Betaproteobacteria bacterium]